jgi:predicted Zn-dependent peptidase
MSHPTKLLAARAPSGTPGPDNAPAQTAVPPLTAPRRARKLRSAERILPTGLRAVAVRKPGIPLVEVRVRVPFLVAAPSHPARAVLLSDAMLTGTAEHDRTGLAATVQALGGELSVHVDADRLLVSGNVLATNLRALLALVASALNTATYPAAEVATERDRLVEKLKIARSQAGVVAGEARARRMWGEHPYARELPVPEAVAATTAAQLRRLHADLVRPDGATLVLVGDVSPARALDQVESALAAWTGSPPRRRVPPLPEPQPGPLLVVDRPGSVQSSLRLGTSAVPRYDNRYPALQLANLIFGGYFSSRWTENIREDKGYTYGPHSRIDHHVLGSSLLFDVEVATEVTAPAVVETRYELGRIASLPVTADEVDTVRQYAIGTLAISTATQSGLASTLSSLAGAGLGLDWLAEHPRQLSAVSVADVSAAAAEFLAPARLTQVVVGEAAAITAPLAALGPVTADA